MHEQVKKKDEALSNVDNLVQEIRDAQEHDNQQHKVKDDLITQLKQKLQTKQQEV